MEFLRPTSNVLGAIEAEVSDKIASALKPAEFAKERLLRLCHERFEAPGSEKIENALAYAESLTSRDPHHPSMKAYLAHPVRVAEFVLRLSREPSTETVMLGLIHNVFEVSQLTETDVMNAGFSRRTANGVRLLTIDRARQYDPIYLTEFYRNIEEFGPDLALAKCADRLDNLLAFDLIERTDKLVLYMDLTEQFVVPLATRLAEDFGGYLLDVLNHMRRSECNETLRLRYESFIKKAVSVG